MRWEVIGPSSLLDKQDQPNHTSQFKDVSRYIGRQARSAILAGTLAREILTISATAHTGLTRESLVPDHS